MNLPNNTSIPFPITFLQVPHCTTGRGGVNPDMIVIHIAEGSKESVYSTFMHEEKSSHFLVNKDGSIWQFVSTADTAWGNGIVDRPTSELVLNRLPQNPNAYSISIEHEGYSTQDITPEQYATTVKLVKFLSQKWAIPLDRTHVIPHHEIEYMKSCPGKINVTRIIKEARETA